MASILIDGATSTLLAVHDYAPAICFVNECTLDTKLVHIFEKPNYEQPGSLNFLWSGKFPFWSWSRKDRKFTETPRHVISDALIQQADLASAKAHYASGIMNHISIIRMRSAQGVEQQDIVYEIKRRQALEFRRTGYIEDDYSKYSYVFEYAEFRNIDQRSAADDIIMKSDLHENVLLNTERLRMKFLNLLKITSTEEEIKPIFDMFMRECYHNTLV